MSQISEIQRQFLTASRLFESSPAYNIASFIPLPPEVDEERLRDAWERVLAAHSVFEGYHAAWDVQYMPPERIPTVASDMANQPLRPDGNQGMRSVLFLAGAEKFWLLVLHHSLTDLFSKNLLAAQMSRAYADSAYKPEAVSYSAFVEQERSFLNSPAGDVARAYWKTKLESAPPVLRLPMSGWHPGPFLGTGRRLPWRASSSQNAKLWGLGASERVPFLVLLTTYVATLARFSGQDRFLVGVPFTNRLKFGNAPLMGPTVNILPLMAQVSPDTTFGQLYSGLRAEMLAGHRQQAFPFLSLAGLALGLERDPLRPWFLQAGFTMESPLALDLEGHRCASLPLDRQGAQMDLFFTWWPGEGGWQGYWEYNDASFSEEDVTTWQQGFDRLLSVALSTPDSKVAEVSLLDLAQESALSRGPEVVFPLDRTMASLLRESYDLHSGETALIWKEAGITYKELETGVAKIAHDLAARSPVNGRVVLVLERGPDLVMAVHGAIHAGHAYVPVGADWPPSRIADIVDDIAPVALISQRRLATRLPAVRCPVLWTEDLLALPEVAFPAVTIGPDDPIHILYTSGTTGRPKGVELPHRGLVNRLLWMQDEYRLNVGDRALLKTPYTFDVSGWELLWPLMVGATLVISEEWQHLDPREILSLIDQQHVRIVHFVPSMLPHFLNAVSPGQASSLTEVICSGEALTISHVSHFWAALPGAHLSNLYGPTEASIDVTYWTCVPADLERGTIPIGRPIANIQVYVLDPAGTLCPPTVKGEVYLGGVGVAKGYWQRPDLTSERFIDHPRFGRLYRTGDWARYGHDGAIEYLERQDLQVKIRGVRVELAEVENHIRNLPQVAQVVVQKRMTPAGEGLVAFYIPRFQAKTPPGELRAALASTLQSALIPEWFFPLEDFPRSENGKVDRKALAQIPLAMTAAPVGAFSEAESRVARLWSRVIGDGSWDNHTNFFDAGGSSLALVSLRALIEEEFSRQVSIAQLFQAPTVSAMVHFLDGVESAKDDTIERVRKQRHSMARRRR